MHSFVLSLEDLASLEPSRCIPHDVSPDLPLGRLQATARWVPFDLIPVLVLLALLFLSLLIF